MEQVEHMNDRIRLGIIGLGLRGDMLMKDVILEMPAFEVVALADRYPKRVERALELTRTRHPESTVEGYTDAHALLARTDLDAVFIATSWDTHIGFAIEAMELGIPVALEVGGAYDLQELWALVDTYERTRTPFMFMENCCFGRLELMTQNMVDQGVLGEIVYCAGGYMHDLREEVSTGWHSGHYRIDNYVKRNTENYPTHEVGPLAKILKINRGNRFLTLSAMASKAAGLESYLEGRTDEKYAGVKGRRFAQGDVVSTTIRCAGGELVNLRLDTTLPRYYSRGFLVQGTRGMVNEENRSVFLDDMDLTVRDHFQWDKHYNNLDQYYEQYEHPIWKSYLDEGVRQGHGGMDWLVFKAFADGLIGGGSVSVGAGSGSGADGSAWAGSGLGADSTGMPIDVYDAATWMAITALAEQSIALGGQPVYFPDFTRGKWMFE